MIRLQVTLGNVLSLLGFKFLIELTWYKAVVACGTMQCTAMRARVMLLILDIFYRDSARNA